MCHTMHCMYEYTPFLMLLLLHTLRVDLTWNCPCQGCKIRQISPCVAYTTGLTLSRHCSRSHHCFHAKLWTPPTRATFFAVSILNSGCHPARGAPWLGGRSRRIWLYLRAFGTATARGLSCRRATRIRVLGRHYGLGSKA